MPFLQYFQIRTESVDRALDLKDKKEYTSWPLLLTTTCSFSKCLHCRPSPLQLPKKVIIIFLDS